MQAPPYPPHVIFNRTQLLLGPEAMQRLSTCHVAVFGVGGVGSWAAEALIRTGLGHLTIVDADRVSPTNINRQSEALQSTVGEVKVESMRSQLLNINPEADITAIDKVYTASTAEDFNLEEYDYIIDAIDSLSDKALLILNTTSCHHPRLFSSMGAALKLDPTKISVAEFWKVQGCPLAAALRRRFRKSGEMPRRKFPCVYSPELLTNRGEVPEDFTDPAQAYGKRSVNGSLCHITAIFGMTLAGLVIEKITNLTVT